MLDGIVLALAMLVATALAMILWARWQPRARGELATLLILAALGLACGVAASTMFAGSSPWPELFWSDDWARITVTAFLGLAALWTLLVWKVSTPTDAARDLMAISGGTLALAARDGFLCWVGAALLVVSRLLPQPSPKGREGSPPLPLGEGLGEGLLGAGAMLYGLALFYYRASTLDLATLSRWLWAQGGHPDLAVWAGVALTLGGLGLITGWLPPYADGAERGPLVSTLGLMLLTRLCHGGFAALADAWRDALIVAGLIAWTWGGFMVSRRGMMYHAPTVIQRGFLLVALGLSTHIEHWSGFWLALAAYALGQGVFGALCHATNGAEQPFAGLLWVKPALGAPLLVALVSLAGLPPLLGFVGRAWLIWAAWGERWIWLAALSALASAVTAARYWPLIATLTRRTQADRQTVVAAPLQMAVGLALGALALIALGLFSAPLIALAHRITP